MSNKRYRTPAAAAGAGPAPGDNPGPACSAEHLDLIRQLMRGGHPLQPLVKERQDAIYADLGGAEVELAISAMAAVIEAGRQVLAQPRPAPSNDEKPPRPLVTAGELIRAVSELRRWHERRERLKEEALLRAAEELQFSRQALHEALQEGPEAAAALPLPRPKTQSSPPRAAIKPATDPRGQPRGPDAAAA